MDDAADVQRLAGDKKVADTTGIPHPYLDGIAEEWIKSLNRENGVTYAIMRKNALYGCISLECVFPRLRGQIDYWLGASYWNNGFMTEAAEAVLRFAFKDLKLNRVTSSHLTRNPASGRVMQKIGMTYEGTLRQHVMQNGVFEDLALYAILASEWRLIHN
jgi:RimJ/RimL family protein N-acetyltransferase